MYVGARNVGRGECEKQEPIPISNDLLTEENIVGEIYWKKLSRDDSSVHNKVNSTIINAAVSFLNNSVIAHLHGKIFTYNNADFVTSQTDDHVQYPLPTEH